MDAATWGRLFVVHVLAAIPFVFLGLMLGFSFGANGAVAAANILFLALASLGGLWIPVFLFPDALQLLSKALPSYHLSEIALGVVDAPRMGEDGPRDLRGHAIAVSAMTVAFAALAAWVWARKR